LTVTTFLDTELVDFASYSTLRAIGSLVDGQKNASRKVIHTVQQKVKADTKVEILQGITATTTEYLHGPTALGGVIVNLAQDFAGSNNLPLLIREGIFGTRFSHSASATRYIFTNKEPYLDKLFRIEDNPILIPQIFEGSVIEPRFFVPTIPLLLVNGSEGIATGFAQKILQRDPKNIIEYITKYINGKKAGERIDPDSKLLLPSFVGYSGEVQSTDKLNQWQIKGKFEKVSLTKIRITEIPVQYELNEYIQVLDELEDRRAIRSYKDLSVDDKFLFEVDIDSKTLKEVEYDTLLNTLGLVKTVTENFTCINEKNRIEEYTSAIQIMHHFITVKLEYTEKRREYIIMKLKEELQVMKSKYFFIKGILDDTIIVKGKTKQEISDQLDVTEHVIKVNDSYDYLTGMAIHSLSKDTFEKLASDIKKKKEFLDEYVKKTVYDIYLEDLEELNTAIN
jgi:DNA topoisomerase-2